LGGVRTYFADGAVEPKHVTLSLIGHFKQLEGDQKHFLLVAAVTGYEIRAREWVERLLLEKAEVVLTLEFLFLKKDGAPAKAIYFGKALVERLEWIQQNTTCIVPLTIKLFEEFGVRRAIRRGATTEVLNAGIYATTIDDTSGWRNWKRQKEKAEVFDAPDVYPRLSVFETEADFLFGYLRDTKGGFRISVLQYWHAFDVSVLRAQVMNFI
jgi:hypothetical protein